MEVWFAISSPPDSTKTRIPFFVFFFLSPQVAQADYESPEQHYPTLLINYSYSKKIIRRCMEKYSLLTKLAKCTLNIALKLTFSVFLFFFVFWLHFRPPRHRLRPFLERQFFTQMTVERREEKVGKPLLTGSAAINSVTFATWRQFRQKQMSW